VDWVKADPHLVAGGARTNTFKKLRSIAACTRTTDWVFVIRDPLPEQTDPLLYLTLFLFYLSRIVLDWLDWQIVSISQYADINPFRKCIWNQTSSRPFIPFQYRRE
jgi:hypothetical protein